MKNLNASNKPLFIQPKIDSGIVILDIDYYESLLKAQQELNLLNKLAIAEQQIKNGEVFTKEELKLKLGIK
ncbi:MAG: hypothetical protein IJZ29_02570 [Clostridia bacterium]|nr:hypothetical protein [Clostridia bacterium]